ncbi:MULTISPECIES: transcriptional regulator [Brucella]|jgi:CheY-like chemotaxis protein|uniref:transcriptional regulator n=1 Tax=Brucella TaxID=234 RepID=UPI0004ED8F98|nr:MULTISPECIES: transcriptional regulator [Brucella]AIK41397.1 response regulator [Brucella anthropi]MDH0369613.1 transcriptional regulator [Brucella anthropi]SUB44872.1 Uncharacterised protein [Brucella anthropi]
MMLSRHLHSQNRVVVRDVKSARDILSFGFRHGQLFVMIRSSDDTMRLFSGKRILVFEDGFLLSEEAGACLTKAGAVVLGPVNTAYQALYYLERERVDAVVMDVTLEPEAVLPVVAELEQSAIPFIFALSDNPILDSLGFAGFVLSARHRDLSTIAEALFLHRNVEH